MLNASENPMKRRCFVSPNSDADLLIPGQIKILENPKGKKKNKTPTN
jgi:hypothetical protein